MPGQCHPAKQAQERDAALLRTTTLVRSFGFFQAENLTILSASTFDRRVHLAWGSMAVNSVSPPLTI